MKDLLGGKGAGLAEMTNAVMPVPPGLPSQQSLNAYYVKGASSPRDVGTNA